MEVSCLLPLVSSWSRFSSSFLEAATVPLSWPLSSWDRSSSLLGLSTTILHSNKETWPMGLLGIALHGETLHFLLFMSFQLLLKWFYALFIPTPGFTIQDLFPSNFERGLDTNLIWNYRDWILVITSYWIQVFLMLHCCTDVISTIFHALNACRQYIQHKLNFNDETLHISCKLF